jgi:DNA polymerase III delta prime subunit
MIARLFISQNPKIISEKIEENLKLVELKNPHPDLLYFDTSEKLGIEQARKIKEHFSLKPFQSKGRGVVLEDGSTLTSDAQNSLLKTLEELPNDAIFLMGASSESKFLPTVLSRCQVIRIRGEELRDKGDKEKEIELLLQASLEERFEYVEKLKEKEEFLKALISYFHKNLPSYIKDKKFLHELLKAEEYANQNVNIRAILEYLMLVMPTKA